MPLAKGASLLKTMNRVEKSVRTSASPCRGAAQFNKIGAGNGAGALSFQIGRFRRAVPDLFR